MKKITENELKNKVNKLREYLTILEAPPTPGMGQKGPTVAAAQGADPSNPLNKAPAAAPATQSAKPAGAPKVAYDKNFPTATAKELQTKLNARDPSLKLTVDGKMGPATRAAMAKYPDVTSNPNAPQNQPAPAAPAPVTPVTSMDDSDDAYATAFVPPTSMDDSDDAYATAFVPPTATAAAQSTMAPGPEVGSQAPTANASNEKAKIGIAAGAPAAAPAMSGYSNSGGNAGGAGPSYAGQGGNQTAAAPAPAAATTQSTKPAAPANPYANNPAQAAIYAAMSPADQQWATKGGGKPDLTDPYIAARAPNKFKPAAAPAPATESVSFRNDELNRIVSLVRHR